MKTLLVLFFNFVSLQSQAGINTVGKGGGFAEMLALKMDRQLSQHLTACLSKPTLCKLSSEGQETALKLTQELTSLQTIPLQFASQCGESPKVTSSQVEIPSCLLYTKNPQQEPVALPVKEISLLVLSVRAEQAGFSKEKVVGPLKSIFSDFKLIEDTYVIALGDKRVVLHSTILEKNHYEKERSLVLEVPAESLDLTDLLAQRLCGTETLKDFQTRFDRAQILNHQRVLFDGEISWECSYPYNQTFKAKISVSALIDSQFAIVPQSPSVLIRQKETVWR